jgi:hypothetical protein
MNLFQSASGSCDAISKNQVAILLVRGIAGIGLMAYSFVLQTSAPIAGWALLAISILLLNGCPACWGMHLVNALRGPKKTPFVLPPTEDKLKSLRKKRYAPKDMAEHLFSPEDVRRFRQHSEP